MKTEQEIKDKRSLLLMKRNTCSGNYESVKLQSILDALDWVMGKKEDIP